MWKLLPKDRVLFHLVTNDRVLFVVTKHRVVYSSPEYMTNNRIMIGLTFILLWPRSLNRGGSLINRSI